MSILKNEEPATRASAMIPVSLNISLDGISGFQMTQLFTIGENFLPYNYLMYISFVINPVICKPFYILRDVLTV